MSTVRVCKWCGSNTRNNGYGVGGWYACSEKCKLELKQSLESGKTEENTSGKFFSGVRTLLIVGFILFFAYAMVFGGESSEDSSTQTYPDEEAVSSEVEPAYQESAYTDDSDSYYSEEAETEIPSYDSDSEYTPQAAEEETYYSGGEQEKNTTVAESVDPRSQAAKLLNNGYSVREVAESTGLTKKEVRQIKRSL